MLQEAVSKNIGERHDKNVSQSFMMVIWVDILEVVSMGPGSSLDEESKGNSKVIQNILIWLTGRKVLSLK